MKHRHDVFLVIAVILAVVFKIIVLRSIAPDIFPAYLFYLAFGLVAFWLASKIDFSVISLFYKPIYVFSVALLLVTIIIGQVTRGAVRWIPLGPITIQPSEIVRPLLALVLVQYLFLTEISFVRAVKSFVLVGIPLVLVVVQPSLGVTFLTAVSFLGIYLASTINKKYFLVLLASLVVSVPLFWGLLANYQKVRVTSFLFASQDPYGAGYNSIQASISVGSGMISGRGLGEGVQTQLQFLPEKHSDFIFASVAEELGFIGALFLIMILSVVFWRLIKAVEYAQSPAARAFITGIFLSLFVQTFVHIGMNMSLLPITGVPLPLISVGGSSFVSTMLSLGLVLGAQKKS
ncbi:MAG: Rod shape-determining protein RodA [uncultured bacterium]|nr:MAG: Rod shape-determining protein RodA [uncultured bacterium]